MLDELYLQNPSLNFTNRNLANCKIFNYFIEYKRVVIGELYNKIIAALQSLKPNDGATAYNRNLIFQQKARFRIHLNPIIHYFVVIYC